MWEISRWSNPTVIRWQQDRICSTATSWSDSQKSKVEEPWLRQVQSMEPTGSMHCRTTAAGRMTLSKIHTMAEEDIQLLQLAACNSVDPLKYKENDATELSVHRSSLQIILSLTTTTGGLLTAQCYCVLRSQAG